MNLLFDERCSDNYFSNKSEISKQQRLLFSKNFTTLEFLFVAQYILPCSIVYQIDMTVGYPTFEMQARRIGNPILDKDIVKCMVANLCIFVYSYRIMLIFRYKLATIIYTSANILSMFDSAKI
jgi:hypothetical protein